MTSSSQAFVARVAYIQPSFEELKRRFPAFVNPYYRGKRFEPIERCKNVSMDVGNSEVFFEYVCVEGSVLADEVLVVMDRKGLRPALYEEMLSFSEQYPDVQLICPIVALGSEALLGGVSLVACLWDAGYGRRLFLGLFDGIWNDRYWFLAVRK